MIFMMLNMVIMRCQQSPYFSWVFMTIIWKWELWKFENSDSWTRSTPMWHYMHGKWLREWFCLNVPSVFESNIEGDSEVKLIDLGSFATNCGDTLIEKLNFQKWSQIWSHGTPFRTPPGTPRGLNVLLMS